MKSKIKLLQNIALSCLFTMMLGLILVTSVANAEEKAKIPVPREAFLPLGALPDENPALFDVVTEPVQKIKSTFNPLVLSVILAGIFSVLILLFLKFRKHIIPKERMKP